MEQAKYNRSRILLHNSIKTPDGKILTSMGVHDYVEYQDENGEIYMVDGGREYLRRSVNIIPYEELSLYNTDTHEKIREVWSRYNQRIDKVVILKDISDDWLDNIIIWYSDRDDVYNILIRAIFENEKLHRRDNKISILLS